MNCVEDCFPKSETYAARPDASWPSSFEEIAAQPSVIIEEKFRDILRDQYRYRMLHLDSRAMSTTTGPLNTAFLVRYAREFEALGADLQPKVELARETTEALDTALFVSLTGEIARALPSLVSRQRIAALLREIENSNSEFAARLKARVEALNRYSIERDPTQTTPLSIESLETFVAFVRSGAISSYPDVGLSPDGEIFAQWRWSRNHQFSVLFLPDLMARFLWLSPVRAAGGRRERVSGERALKRIVDMMQFEAILAG